MLPEPYKKRMEKMLGGDFERYEAALALPSVKAVRINTRKIDPAAFASVFPFATEAISYDRDGAYVNVSAEDRLGNLPLHHAGAFYVQEPSAMAPVDCLPLSPAMRVLDVCASPGGKSIQALSRGVRFLVSNEINAGRCSVLMGNIERMGFENAAVLNLDSAGLAKTYPAFFDAVICDAPCSGEGMFRKLDVAVSEWSEENVALCAERQREILANAAQCVAPNGYLLYSTCTFAPEEDEAQIAAFLSAHPDFSLCDVPDAVKAVTAPGTDMPEARRFYPHTGRGEGQFMAVLRRADLPPVEEKKKKEKDPKPDPAAEKEKTVVRAFLSETLADLPDGNLVKLGDGYALLPPGMTLPPYGVFAAGVKIGEVQKGRVVPHHQFFSAFGKRMKNQIALPSDDPRVARYISGEVIEVDAPDGWCVLLVDGAPLGGGKTVAKMMKNHYPKGLRKQL